MVLQVKENFVTDAKGKRIAVLLPIKEYNKMLEELEDYDDYIRGCYSRLTPAGVIKTIRHLSN